MSKPEQEQIELAAMRIANDARARMRASFDGGAGSEYLWGLGKGMLRALEDLGLGYDERKETLEIEAQQRKLPEAIHPTGDW
jgi:hypothetical protein